MITDTAQSSTNVKKIWARNQPILLVLCGQGFNREYQGHYNRYKVLIGGKPIQAVFTKEELNDLSYWVNRSGVMAMTIWGSSQEFEAKEKIMMFLGWYEQVGKNWSAFTCLFDEKIKVV